MRASRGRVEDSLERVSAGGLTSGRTDSETGRRRVRKEDGEARIQRAAGVTEVSRRKADLQGQRAMSQR